MAGAGRQRNRQPGTNASPANQDEINTEVQGFSLVANVRRIQAVEPGLSLLKCDADERKNIKLFSRVSQED